MNEKEEVAVKVLKSVEEYLTGKIELRLDHDFDSPYGSLEHLAANSMNKLAINILRDVKKDMKNLRLHLEKGGVDGLKVALDKGEFNA